MSTESTTTTTSRSSTATGAPLTPEIRAMRVAIARDMLVQIGNADRPLRIGKIGVYLSGRLPREVPYEADVKDHVETLQRFCAVCELGGLLLSKARLFNAVPWSGIALGERSINAQRASVVSALSDVFDAPTLDMLEAAFEGNTANVSHVIDADRDRLFNAVEFGRRYPASRERSVAITENLIENNGEFLP